MLDVLSGSAIPLAEEVANGPAAEPSLRAMMRNANAQNNAGALITISNNTTGLAIDPNGGTWTGYYTEIATNTQPTVPHFVWVDDGGSYACTVFSTRLNPVNNLPGSVAVIAADPQVPELGRALDQAGLAYGAPGTDADFFCGVARWRGRHRRPPHASPDCG